MDKLLKMVLRRLARQMVNKSIDAGVKRASSGGGEAARQSPKLDAKRARQAMRVLRRMSRF